MSGIRGHDYVHGSIINAARIQTGSRIVLIHFNVYDRECTITFPAISCHSTYASIKFFSDEKRKKIANIITRNS